MITDEAVAFENEMRSALGLDFTVTSIGGFADLMWGVQSADLESLECLLVDSRHTERRIAFLRIHGKIRYWLSTAKDPYRRDEGFSEIGTIASIGDAASLCREFLDSDALPRDLTTKRDAPVLSSVIIKRSWDTSRHGALDLSAVQKLHPGARVTVQRYPAHASFSGATRAGSCYVVSGSFSVSFDASSARGSQGDVLEFPEGRYDFVAHEDVELIRAWPLPPGFK